MFPGPVAVSAENMRLFTTKAVWFSLAGVLALAVYFLVYELRYNWYLKASDGAFVRLSCIASMLTVAGLWVFFPSRTLVAGIAFIGFLIPPTYESGLFVKLDWRFAPWVALSVALLVGATELRRRIS